MQPDALLKLAQNQPSKFGLEAHRDTVCELRRKGFSWRAIADFLIEKGVKTDHTRVYRLMIEGNPLYDHSDAPVIIHGQQYESQKGEPLRPYGQGMFISVEAKLCCIPLEHPESVKSNYCEYQFQLSSIPNQAWLKQLHVELRAEFKPDYPQHLVSMKGFELKFLGNVMALVCPSYNLELHAKEVIDGVMRATQILFSDKAKMDALWKLMQDRDKKILEFYHQGEKTPVESADEILEDHSAWHLEEAKRLKEKFDALSLHPSLDSLPPKT